MSVFKETQKLIYNNTFDLECEDIELFGHKLWIYYDISSDDIFIVKWNDFHGDIDFVVDPSKIDSFIDTIDLEVYEDAWDYATESVYQIYSEMDLDDYMDDNGRDELIEHVSDELHKKGLTIHKRSLKDRIQRFMLECKWEIKNYFKNIIK